MAAVDRYSGSDPVDGGPGIGNFGTGRVFLGILNEISGTHGDIRVYRICSSSMPQSMRGTDAIVLQTYADLLAPQHPASNVENQNIGRP